MLKGISESFAVFSSPNFMRMLISSIYCIGLKGTYVTKIIYTLFNYLPKFTSICGIAAMLTVESIQLSLIMMMIIILIIIMIIIIIIMIILIIMIIIIIMIVFVSQEGNSQIQDLIFAVALACLKIFLQCIVSLK